MPPEKYRYWPAARSHAKKRTRFFHPYKAIPSVITTLVGTLFLKLQPLPLAALLIAILIGTYLFLHALEFLWNLFINAPAALTESLHGELLAANTAIHNLHTKPSIDSEREQEVATRITTFNDSEKNVLRWLLKHVAGEIEVTQIFARSKLPEADINSTLKKGKTADFLINNLDAPKTGNYWQINPGYREALQNCLFPGNP